MEPDLTWDLHACINTLDSMLSPTVPEEVEKRSRCHESPLPACATRRRGGSFLLPIPLPVALR